MSGDNNLTIGEAVGDVYIDALAHILAETLNIARDRSRP